MRAKVLIHSAWLKKLDWDTLPSADALFWRNLFTELPHLNEIRVSRWLGSDGSHSQVELHVLRRLGARIRRDDVPPLHHHECHIAIYLLAAKGKMASVKPVSLPRLELYVVTLLTNLTRARFQLCPQRQSSCGLTSAPRCTGSKDTPPAGRPTYPTEYHKSRSSYQRLVDYTFQGEIIPRTTPRKESCRASWSVTRSGGRVQSG